MDTTAEQPAHILSVEHLQKSFSRGKKNVLKDVSFTAESKECIGILGANGCGKSTLLSILAGIQVPDAGSILFQDEPLFAKKEKNISSCIGYVPQEPPLIPELNAYDNLKLWYSDSHLSLEQELQSGFLSVLGIPSFLKVQVKKMSGGMKKRLSIGCCIAENPKVLLLDEPSAALDIPCKKQIETYLAKYKEAGNTIILTTHEEREIKFCDRLYILKNGMLSSYVYDGNIHHVADAVENAPGEI